MAQSIIFSKLTPCLPEKSAMLGNHGFSSTGRSAELLQRYVVPVHATRRACTASVTAVIAPAILGTDIVILRNQKSQYKIDAMGDHAKIDRDRCFTSLITYLRKPAHCGQSARVAPPSLRFPAEAVMSSIELSLVCGFRRNKNFLSTLLF